MNFKEKYNKRKKTYLGKAVGFAVDEIILPDGKKAVREYLLHNGAVAALAFVNKTDIIMVQQYRYPVGKLTCEIPAGKIDKGENPVACVKRELAEETGLYPKRVKKIFSYWPTSAFSNEVIHIYVADKLVPSKHKPDEDEFLKTKVVPFKQALRWALTGRIRDSKTVIALLWWAQHGNR